MDNHSADKVPLSNSMAEDAELSPRDKALFDVAFEMFVISNNRPPTREQADMLAQTFGPKLNIIPTEALLETLDKATVFSAPHPPKVTDMLAVWKQENPAPAPRYATYSEVEEAKIALGLRPDPRKEPESDRFAVSSKIHMQRLADGKEPIYCNCVYHYRSDSHVPFKNRQGDTPTRRSLAVLSHDKTRWVCAGMAPAEGLIPTGPCDFVMNEKKARTWGDMKREKAKESNPIADAHPDKKLLDEMLANRPEIQTPEEMEGAPMVEEKPRELTLEMFALKFGWDLLVMEPNELEGVRQFFEWCQSQEPPMKPTRNDVENVWAQWQFEIGAVAA